MYAPLVKAERTETGGKLQHGTAVTLSTEPLDMVSIAYPTSITDILISRAKNCSFLPGTELK